MTDIIIAEFLRWKSLVDEHLATLRFANCESLEFPILEGKIAEMVKLLKDFPIYK